MSIEKLEAELATMAIRHANQADEARKEQAQKRTEIAAAKRDKADRERLKKREEYLAKYAAHVDRYAPIAERARKAGVNILWVDKGFVHASGTIGCPILSESIKDGMVHIEYDGVCLNDPKSLRKHTAWAIGADAMITLDCAHLISQSREFTKYDDDGLVGITGSIVDGKLLICDRNPAPLVDELKRHLAEREVVSDRIRSAINATC